ncbi:MAG TPA: IS200/IS605 family transposase, partial [Candidatus Binatia bacterium]|nr:IS200/IS605 family transposase [Candidatus Binatia bacterium]
PAPEGRKKMSHTLGNVLLHFIFSTHQRRPTIEPFREDLHAYLGGILRQLNATALAVNGTSDHVHMLVRVRPSQSAAEIARLVKTNSSRWVREKWRPDFAWQTGYGVFSVSESSVAAVVKYIARQEEHHRRVSFQQEFVVFLNKNHVQYDERYIWDWGSSSLALSGLDFPIHLPPTACAVGGILSPLRGCLIGTSLLFFTT